MVSTISHTFVSPKIEGGDATIVGSNEWNALHTTTGLPGDSGFQGLWVDLRAYGNYPTGWTALGGPSFDITAALNAAFADLAGKRNKRLYIPEISGLDGFPSNTRLAITSTVTIPASTGGSTGWTILIGASDIQLWTAGGAGTKGIILCSQCRITGLIDSSTGVVGPYIRPGVNITTLVNTLETIFYARDKSNIFIENIQIQANTRGVWFENCDTSTIRHCAIGSQTAGHRSVLIDSSFWMNIEECWFDAGGSGYGIEYATSNGDGGGIGVVRDTVISGANGILWNAGTNLGSPGGILQGFIVYDMINENTAGHAFTFDGTACQINDVQIYRGGGSDAVSLSYDILNIGNNTRGIKFIDTNNVSIDPASTNIEDLEVILPSGSNTGRIDARGTGDDATTCQNYGRCDQTAIDKRLHSTPRSPFMMFANADSTCNQNGSTWTLNAGNTRTNNVMDPTGSFNATRIANSNDDEITGIYSKSYTPSVGDWIIGAIWMRPATANDPGAFGQHAYFDFSWSGSKTGSAFNGSTSLAQGQPGLVFTFENVREAPYWKFGILALKLTALGTGNLTYSLKVNPRVGLTYDFYMPSIIFIPVSAGWSDYDVTTWVRACRNTWPSNAKQGQMILPYTGQSFRAPGSVLCSADVAVPAGGTADTGLLMSSTAHLGMFFGSGTPSLSAAKGSFYMRTDGTSTTTRAYINTDGGTTWTAITTVA